MKCGFCEEEHFFRTFRRKIHREIRESHEAKNEVQYVGDNERTKELYSRTRRRGNPERTTNSSNKRRTRVLVFTYWYLVYSYETRERSTQHAKLSFADVLFLKVFFIKTQNEKQQRRREALQFGHTTNLTVEYVRKPKAYRL